MVFNSDYERLDYYYKKKWVSESQLRLYVQYKVLTATEFKAITGKTYK